MDQFFAGGGALQVPFGADFFSVAVGVLTGAIFACDRKLDIVGTIVLGLVTAYGGGIIRDLLLQDHGVYFMEYPEVILICICLAVFVFYFRGLFRHTARCCSSPTRSRWPCSHWPGPTRPSLAGRAS